MIDGCEGKTGSVRLRRLRFSERIGMTGSDHDGGRIRRLNKADVDAVGRICNAAVVRGEYTHGPKQLTPEHVVTVLFDVPACFESYAYETSAGIVGWAGLLRYHEREAYGATAELVVYVSPEHRRCGIGRILAQHVLARAPELGFHVIVLILQAEPAYLLAAAARLGFRCTGRLASVLPVGEEWRDIYVFQRFVLTSGEGAQ